MPICGFKVFNQIFQWPLFLQIFFPSPILSFYFPSRSPVTYAVPFYIALYMEQDIDFSLFILNSFHSFVFGFTHLSLVSIVIVMPLSIFFFIMDNVNYFI